MNTKGNQRTVQTENRIKKVFLDLLGKKEIGSISVSEICREARIHRTTFYVHYKDVADLMDHLVGEMYLQIKELLVEEGKGMRSHGLQKLFDLVGQHREFFRVCIETMGVVEFTFDRLPEELQKNIERIVPEMGFASGEELLYHQIFFCQGLSAVIRRWIAGGCKESPEQMERIIVSEYKPGRKEPLRA